MIYPLCECGHEERHHDNEAGKCDKIGCDCQTFWIDYDALLAQLAALTAERDGLREALKDLLAWAHIQDHHSAQAVSIRGRAWAALNEPTNQIQLDNGEHE